MYIFRLIVQYFEENYFSSSLNADYENLNFTGTVTTLLMIVGGVCLGILLASYVIIFEKRVVGRFVRSLLLRGATDAKTALSLSDLGLERNGFIKRELSRASVSRKLVSIVGADGNVRCYEDELALAFPEFAASLKENAVREDEASSAPSADENTVSEETASEEDLIPDEDREDANAPQKGVGSRAKAFFFEKKFRLAPLDFATARFFIPEALSYRASLRFREKGSSPWWLLLATLVVLALFLVCLRFIPAFVGMLDVSISNIKGN